MLIGVALVAFSCNSPATVTMVDGLVDRSPGRALVSSDERCDMAGVAKKAFQKAYPGENGSAMQLYGQEVGRCLHSRDRAEGGAWTAFELGPAGASSSPPDQSLIDQWADTPLAEGI